MDPFLSAVKRIMQEARELANDPSTDYSAAPLEDDIFEWHCTIRGPSGTEFDGGLYHFRILLPSEYPFRPPSIMMLTPSGRFELNKKICISFTNYHEELWQPAWGVRTAIIGLQGFLPLKGSAAVGVGAIEYPTTEHPPAPATSSETSEPSTAEQKSNPPPAPISATESSQPSQPPPAHQQQPSSPSVPLLAPTPTRPVASVNLVVNQEPTSPVFIGPSTPVDDPSEEASSSPSVTTASASHGSTSTSTQTQSPPSDRPPIILRRSTPRPPIILDTAICVLLVLVFALICRRVL
ncbi:hypothetical protein EIP91_001341 [Steccherinum ochraceum]|uniref:UBC core domain-containing protein n=1 Tax=Steccherinum ochraceum TaxID=92696 RepID=A0A4R0REB3_9APHY|nr:hypothetical protein EIP91_001341 [Steccherinum ochraceum]